MAKDLGMDASMMNIAVSITALFSGIFIVVFGGLADKVGRVKIIRIGFYFSIIGSLLVGLTPVGNAAEAVLITGRIFQGLSAAAIMPASLALVKAYWEGKERQRAISLWSMGSWGGSGFAALFGGLMVSVGWRWIFFGAAAVSAGIFAAFNAGDNIQWLEGVLTFVGRQDNVVVREAATIGLGVNLMMIVMAILIILITIPKSAGKTND